MQRTQISTNKAPAAIGPYSQAIRYGQFVYTAGQVALDPATGQLVGEDVQAQTHRALQNLQAVLDNAGTSLAKVVKTTQTGIGRDRVHSYRRRIAKHGRTCSERSNNLAQHA